ncbi:MAG: hypothetical protein AAB606_02195 [Patescibacteria group bacterium]
MAEKNFFKQKTLGITLIVCASLVLVLTLVLKLWWNENVIGYSSMLPAKETIAYVEMPEQLTPIVIEKIKEELDLDWNAKVLPMLEGPVALALVKTEKKGSFLPFLMLNTKYPQSKEVFPFLEEFKNSKRTMKQTGSGTSAIFATDYMAFTFYGNMVIISTSASALETFNKYQSPLTAHLSSAQDFVQIRKNLNQPFFAYSKEREIPKSLYAYLSQSLSSAPFLTDAFASVGAAAELRGGTWYGSSYAIPEKSMPIGTERAYRAQLLQFLPSDFNILLAGQNLPGQISKIESLIEEQQKLPTFKTLFSLITKDYLGGKFPDEIREMFSKEFAFTVTGDKVLFIAELPEKDAGTGIEHLRAAIKTAAGTFTPIEREVTLPDGSRAFELVPDPSQVKVFSEQFEGVEIKSIQFGKRGQTIYDAAVGGKWFLSNDLDLIRKSLLLIKEPGANMLESKQYKEFLRPILKNPELLGISSAFGTNFAFSKRTFPDHMETNFVFVVE